MVPTIPEPLKDELWTPQQEAVEFIAQYLASDSASAAMVNMPTGTGKTGVMAIVASYFTDQRSNRIIATPWVSVRRQITREVSTGFWRRLPATGKPLGLRVVEWETVDQAAESLVEKQGSVFVTTLSLLHKLVDTRAETHPHLFEHISLTMIDEGHYEPAEQWSRSIRQLGTPTILFTATPYRNDLRLFAVNPQWCYRFTQANAISEGITVTPEFVGLDASHDDTTARAIESLLASLRDSVPDARAIVRCKSASRIHDIVSFLAQGPYRILGVHDQFHDSELFCKEVPPEQIDGSAKGADILVHQFKLIEGVDDSRFRLLVVVDELASERALIQQIGRITRHPYKPALRPRAIVASRNRRATEDSWRRFLDWDARAEVGLDLVGAVSQAAIDSQPRAGYLDGKFRGKFEPGATDAWQHLAFPMKVQVFDSGERPPNAQLLLDRTLSGWERDDRVVLSVQRPDTNTAIALWLQVANTPYLSDALLLDTQFGYTFIRTIGNRAYWLDTSSRGPIDSTGSLRVVAPADMARLLPDSGSRITSVSLRNTNLGDGALRTRGFSAYSLDNRGGSVADFAYVCSTAEGVISGSGLRRYLGLGRSRISDAATWTDFAGYTSWLQGLHDVLESDTAANGTFERYAEHVSKPVDPTPDHVLLDLCVSDFIFENGDAVGDAELAKKVDQHGNFKVRVGSQSCEVQIVWDKAEKRYRISSQDLDGLNLEVAGEPGERVRLVDAVNRDQRLRVVTKAKGEVYDGGSFFRLNVTGGRARQVLRLLTPVGEFGRGVSEKGPKTWLRHDDWDPKSLFGMISSLADEKSANRSLFEALEGQTISMLLCTDLGAEVADWVIVTDRKAIVVHAKAKAGKGVSASHLHDVAAQVQKSLSYVMPGARKKPSLKTWEGKWLAREEAPRLDKAKNVVRDNDGNIVKVPEWSVDKRARIGPLVGEEAWQVFHDATRDPSVAVEVWMVIGGGMLSVKELTNALRKSEPRTEVLQVLSLLLGVAASVEDAGARLRIFCAGQVT